MNHPSGISYLGLAGLLIASLTFGYAYAALRMFDLNYRNLVKDRAIAVRDNAWKAVLYVPSVLWAARLLRSIDADGRAPGGIDTHSGYVFEYPFADWHEPPGDYPGNHSARGVRLSTSRDGWAGSISIGRHCVLVGLPWFLRTRAVELAELAAPRWHNSLHDRWFEDEPLAATA